VTAVVCVTVHVHVQMIVNPRNAEAKDLSINNPLSQEVEVCQFIAQALLSYRQQKQKQQLPVDQSAN